MRRRASRKQPDLTPYENYPINYDPMFVAFHDSHPDLYRKVVEHARALKAQGYTEVGMKFLLEYQRYQADEPAGDRVYFALNNTFATLYGRLIEAQEEDLRGYFRLRCRGGERAAGDPKQHTLEFD